MNSGRLNCRCSLYGKRQSETELGDLTYRYDEIGKLWAEIIPTNGKTEGYTDGSEWQEISHKVRIRRGQYKITNDMYLLFNNLKLEIKYPIDDYKKRNYIYLYCKLVLEEN